MPRTTRVREAPPWWSSPQCLELLLIGRQTRRELTPTAGTNDGLDAGRLLTSPMDKLAKGAATAATDGGKDTSSPIVSTLSPIVAALSESNWLAHAIRDPATQYQSDLEFSQGPIPCFFANLRLCLFVRAAQLMGHGPGSSVCYLRRRMCPQNFQSTRHPKNKVIATSGIYP